MSAPLSGVVVLDLTRLLPGAYCTWLLSSLGAEVIKIEEPGRGDYQREFPPFVGGVGAMYRMLNRGKASVALDLKDPHAVELFADLVAARASVVVESFRPGVMSRLGLGAERLQSLRPSLVYASLSGYGGTGPLAATAGHDINYLAAAGYLSDRLEHRMNDVPWADVIGGGLVPALGITALLHRARATGEGGVLDVALMEGLALMPRPALVDALVKRLGESSASASASDVYDEPAQPYYGIYELADGHVAVGAVEPKFWQDLCEALGLPHFRDAQDDAERTDEIRLGLAAAFRHLTRAEVENIFRDVDACVTVVVSPAELLDTDLARARQYVREVPGELATLGSPFVIDGTRAYSDGPAPEVGTDTVRVLRESGIADAKITKILDGGSAR